jgi:hypothetical protein
MKILEQIGESLFRALPVRMQYLERNVPIRAGQRGAKPIVSPVQERFCAGPELRLQDVAISQHPTDVRRKSAIGGSHLGQRINLSILYAWMSLLVEGMLSSPPSPVCQKMPRLGTHRTRVAATPNSAPPKMTPQPVDLIAIDRYLSPRWAKTNTRALAAMAGSLRTLRKLEVNLSFSFSDRQRVTHEQFA